MNNSTKTSNHAIILEARLYAHAFVLIILQKCILSRDLFYLKVHSLSSQMAFVSITLELQSGTEKRKKKKKKERKMKQKLNSCK